MAPQRVSFPKLGKGDLVARFAELDKELQVAAKRYQEIHAEHAVRQSELLQLLTQEEAEAAGNWCHGCHTLRHECQCHDDEGPYDDRPYTSADDQIADLIEHGYVEEAAAMAHQSQFFHPPN